MLKISSSLLIVLFVFSFILSGISCSSKQKQPELKKQVAAVQRGNLTISVSVDGSLVMPQAFDLRFGAPGDVKDVLVEEGDFVKAGTILARLDDTAQRLDIESANNNVQTVLSNLYETVPRLPQFPTTSLYPLTPPVTTAATTTTATVQTYFTPPDTLPPPGTTTVTTTASREALPDLWTKIVTRTDTTIVTTIGHAAGLLQVPQQ